MGRVGAILGSAAGAVIPPSPHRQMGCRNARQMRTGLDWPPAPRALMGATTAQQIVAAIQGGTLCPTFRVQCTQADRMLGVPSPSWRLPSSRRAWPPLRPSPRTGRSAASRSSFRLRLEARPMFRHGSWPRRCRSIWARASSSRMSRVPAARPDRCAARMPSPTDTRSALATWAPTPPSVATNPKLPYDPRTDFDYLGIHLVTPNLMIVRKDFPAQTLQEFVAYAKAKGKDLKMGHNGAGSLSHLTCVLFFQLAGVEPTYVVYRGFGQTINDILSGSIDGTCDLDRLGARARARRVGQGVRGCGRRAVAAVAGRADVQGRRPARIHGRELARALCARKVSRRRSWPSCARPRWLPSKIPWCKRDFPRSAAASRRKEDRGGDRMLEIVKSDVVRWSEVVKKAGGVEAKP